MAGFDVMIEVAEMVWQPLDASIQAAPGRSGPET
jgi:hypothetical protein